MIIQFLVVSSSLLIHNNPGSSSCPTGRQVGGAVSAGERRYRDFCNKAGPHRLTRFLQQRFVQQHLLRTPVVVVNIPTPVLVGTKSPPRTSNTSDEDDPPESSPLHQVSRSSSALVAAWVCRPSSQLHARPTSRLWTIRITRRSRGSATWTSRSYTSRSCKNRIRHTIWQP